MSDFRFDKQLKRSSRGLLAEILSYPPDERPTLAQLAENGPEGRDAIRGMVVDLAAHGYAALTPKGWVFRAVSVWPSRS